MDNVQDIRIIMDRLYPILPSEYFHEIIKNTCKDINKVCKFLFDIKQKNEWDMFQMVLFIQDHLQISTKILKDMNLYILNTGVTYYYFGELLEDHTWHSIERMTFDLGVHNPQMRNLISVDESILDVETKKSNYLFLKEMGSYCSLSDSMNGDIGVADCIIEILHNLKRSMRLSRR